MQLPPLHKLRLTPLHLEMLAELRDLEAAFAGRGVPYRAFSSWFGGIPPYAMTRIVTYLRRLGLVSVEHGPTGRRVVAISLTDLGRDLLNREGGNHA